MKILIKNVTVLPMTGEDYFNGAIGIEGDKIVMVTDEIERIADFEAGNGVEIIDGSGKIAMPGLINAHTHSAMSLMRGYADDMPLMEWLTDKIWPLEAKLDSEDIYWGAKLSVAEMISSGTTTYVDMYWDVEANAKVVRDTGIRSYFGVTVMDRCIDREAAMMDEYVEKYNNTCDGRLHLMIAPHAPYTCSPNTLRKSVTIAEKHDLMIHTHLCETKVEMDTIKKLYGVSPVDYYIQNGVFTLPLLAAHGVMLTESDMEKLSRYNVSIVHNPISNMKLSSGAAPVTKMLSAGLNVALGTDGASSNNNLDMFEELRTAALLQKLITSDPSAIKAYEALYMATVAGAKALGREKELGMIKEGMLADIILIDSKSPHLNPLHNVVASIAYSGKGSDVDTVIVGGNILMKGHKLLTIDRDECSEMANKRADRLVKLINE